MKAIIVAISLLCVITSCGSRHREPEYNMTGPIEILSILADDPGDGLNKKVPVPGCYYIKNFVDDKEHLKDVLQYMKDTVPARKLDDDAEFFLLRHSDDAGFGESPDYGPKKGVGSFYCFFSKDMRYFKRFGTWSKEWVDLIANSKGPFNYYCQLSVEDGKCIVMLDYSVFNTDVFQRFLNVVFYERNQTWIHYDMQRWNKIDSRKWIAYRTFILRSKQTGVEECVVDYSNNDDYFAFTIDILD
ncbi:MAG: hypothetical protein LBN24_01275 [Mediterranea sp.]|jgi:hypothetical protein|nr:hypothetical protein [Mediterranea sp.]